MARIIIAKDFGKPIPSEPGVETAPFDELKRWLESGKFLRRIFRYESSTLLVHNADFLLKPFLSLLSMRLLSRGRCTLADSRGREKAVTTGILIRLFLRLLADWIAIPGLFAKIRKEIAALQTTADMPPQPLQLDARPVYLRTDLTQGLVSGGSVGHVAGVLNNLDHFCGKPVFLTADSIPTVRDDIEMRIVPLPARFLDFRELPALCSNPIFLREAKEALRERRPSLIFQRYSAHNYAGLRLARKLEVPLVLEYNGSEVWMGKHWGRRLRYEALAERIEMLNLRGADVVVVVSRPMKDELAGRGVDPEKILVNPNGVDPDRYFPEVDGSGVRKRLGFDGKIVIGFIGTFGPWHGAEMLAEAFGRLMRKQSSLLETTRLLLIGDGLRMPKVKEALARHGVEGLAALTGLIPQHEGPAHLAACDILVSPHVPNPDGTAFFGSPTKLFEYMAMGRGIVASDLGQIGEILEHGHTAWMVRPGDADALAEGLRVLIEDPDRRERLGRAARREAVAKYTWREHTRKIVEKIREMRG